CLPGPTASLGRRSKSYGSSRAGSIPQSLPSGVSSPLYTSSPSACRSRWRSRSSRTAAFPTRSKPRSTTSSRRRSRTVAKYAQASRGSVAVERSNGVATVIVSDDGVGGAELVPGSGLVGLADRVEALGGRLRLESPLGQGTRLEAEIPCD